MKRSICTFFVLLLCVSLCACGKDEAVVEVEEMIDQLPLTANFHTEPLILEVERAYDALTEKQAKKVENYEALAELRRKYDALAASDPFAVAYWKLADHDRDFVNDIGLSSRLAHCSKNKMPCVEIVEVWRDGNNYEVVTLKEGDRSYCVNSRWITSTGSIKGSISHYPINTPKYYYIGSNYIKDESYDLEKINEVINLYKFEGDYEKASWSNIIFPKE